MRQVKMEQKCRHMRPLHDSSKTCRLSGCETKEIMVSGRCFCVLQSHKCAFYPSTYKQPPPPPYTHEPVWTGAVTYVML